MDFDRAKEQLSAVGSSLLGTREKAPSTPSTPSPALSAGMPWPEPMGAAAYHGIAGEFVELVGPHTEADPAALLVQLLVAVGNSVGRGPHVTAEADYHPANLYGNVSVNSKDREESWVGNVLSQRIPRVID